MDDVIKPRNVVGRNMDIYAFDDTCDGFDGFDGKKVGENLWLKTALTQGRLCQSVRRW